VNATMIAPAPLQDRIAQIKELALDGPALLSALQAARRREQISHITYEVIMMDCPIDLSAGWEVEDDEYEEYCQFTLEAEQQSGWGDALSVLMNAEQSLICWFQEGVQAISSKGPMLPSERTKLLAMAERAASRLAHR
jgi:hypothetical protein